MSYLHFYHFYHTDPVITTTDDFEVDDDTTTTDQLYQEYYANLYALGFRLVVS